MFESLKRVTFLQISIIRSFKEANLVRLKNHDLIFTREESVESPEGVSELSENSSVNFRIKNTNRLVVFNYSSLCLQHK